MSGGRDSEKGIPLQSVEHHWLLIFKKYDHDNDGRISLREICYEINDASYANDIPEKAVQNIFNQHDVNGDGYISFEEFLSLLESDTGRRLLNRSLNRYIKHVVAPKYTKRVVRHRDITDGEYEELYSCFPPPFCMLLVSLLEILAFLYDIYFSASNEHLSQFGPAGKLFYYSPSKKKESWRFLTYMFVHANASHLIVNLLVQLLLGIPLEMVHHWWRVLLIYLAGVLAGSLGTSISDPDVSLVGASGGVYALIAAHLSTIILNWSEMEFAVSQLTVFLSLTVFDCGTAIYARYFSDDDLKIGYVAHLAGAVAGLLVGLYVLRNLEVHSWERVLKWTGFLLYIFLVSLAIGYNVVTVYDLKLPI